MADIPIAQALEWVGEAGIGTLAHFRSEELAVGTKTDGSPVTLADHEAEALLRQRITDAFPDDAIHGEEQQDRLGSSGRTWVIDPIDGTKAFSHGVGTFSNLLALTDDQGPVLGVINLPALDETLWAVRDQGAWMNGAPVTIDHRRRHSESRLLCVSGFDGWDAAEFARLAEAGVQIRTWGDAYGYALVATGRADAMFDPHLEWWDLAAPSLIVSQAGGKVTRRDGSSEIASRSHDGPYAFSAIASSDGDHEFWVDLLNG